MTRSALALLLPLMLSCQMTESEAPEAAVPLRDLVVHAQVEVPEQQEGTKVFMDENCRLYWNAGDRISFFPKTTQNCPFTFLGNDGDKSGDFSTIMQEGASATTVDKYYAAYPYREGNSIAADGTLTLELPAAQTYHAGTFDPQAQLMTAVSSTPAMDFRNVCCVMGLQLYGAGVQVKSLTVSGKNGEILAGPMTVTAGDAPTFSFTGAATATAVTLTAETPVALDATTPTLFWIALPPVTFQDGFTLQVVDVNDQVFSKSTGKTISLQRNRAHRMAALEVCFTPTAQGFYLEGSEPYVFAAATDQLNIYEAEGSAWVRFITPGTFKVRELGPLPASLSVGDSFAAAYTETVGSQEMARQDFPSLEVVSYEGGVLTLSDTQSYFIFRF